MVRTPRGSLAVISSSVGLSFFGPRPLGVLALAALAVIGVLGLAGRLPGFSSVGPMWAAGSIFTGIQLTAPSDRAVEIAGALCCGLLLSAAATTLCAPPSQTTWGTPGSITLPATLTASLLAGALVRVDLLPPLNPAALCAVIALSNAFDRHLNHNDRDHRRGASNQRKEPACP